MKVLYLDQNKWIDLARARNSPTEKPAHTLALVKIQQAVESNELLIPLTASNIYETQKINDMSRRQAIARLQAALSNGMVFQCGSFRLRHELTNFLCEHSGRSNDHPQNRWFLSDFFLDAFAERKVMKIEHGFDFALAFNQRNAKAALYSYLIDLPDEARQAVVKNFSESSSELISHI